MACDYSQLVIPNCPELINEKYVDDGSLLYKLSKIICALGSNIFRDDIDPSTVSLIEQVFSPNVVIAQDNIEEFYKIFETIFKETTTEASNILNYIVVSPKWVVEQTKLFNLVTSSDSIFLKQTWSVFALFMAEAVQQCKIGNINDNLIEYLTSFLILIRAGLKRHGILLCNLMFLSIADIFKQRLRDNLYQFDLSLEPKQKLRLRLRQERGKDVNIIYNRSTLHQALNNTFLPNVPSGKTMVQSGPSVTNIICDYLDSVLGEISNTTHQDTLLHLFNSTCSYDYLISYSEQCGKDVEFLMMTMFNKIVKVARSRQDLIIQSISQALSQESKTSM